MPDIDPTPKQHLQEKNVKYEVVEIDPAYADTAEFCQKYDWPPEQSANCILVASKTDPPQYAACVLLATTRLDVNHVVKKRLGNKRVSFANAEVTKEVTGMELGGVTPAGLPNEVPLWIDSAVMEKDLVIIGGGNRDTKIKLSPDGLVALGGEVVENLAN